MSHPGMLLQPCSCLLHVELTQEVRMDPEDDDETMVRDEPEPNVSPRAVLAQLSPNSCMAIRARRQWVGNHLLEQFAQNHEAMWENVWQEHKDYLEQMRCSWEEEQESPP
ncbi:UNVERIFIED_CONTAM: hypothetical protein K2H54_051126 [Gekko kuhli]